MATRLQSYRDQTAPVLAWYESRGSLIRIPAVGPVDDIATRVRRALALAQQTGRLSLSLVGANDSGEVGALAIDRNSLLGIVEEDVAVQAK